MLTTNKFLLRPSRYLLALLIFIYAGPMVFISFLPLKLVWLLLLQGCCFMSLIQNARRYALLASKNAIYLVQVNKYGEWLLLLRNGKKYEAKLTGESYAQPWLAVLNFKLDGKKKRVSVPVMPDSLNKTDFRRIRGQIKLFARKR